MDDFLLRLYLEQAKEECERCFSAISELNASIGKKDGTGPFPHAQALVHHAAAVSRIFWPPGGHNKARRQRSHRRGESLRRILAIPSPHAVQSRSLRDHFEHFDERLDEWAERSKNKNIVMQLVGPRSAIGGDAVEDGDIIHHYDPATKVYAFRGEDFNVQLLADGLSDLHARVSKKLATLWPYNRGP